MATLTWQNRAPDILSKLNIELSTEQSVPFLDPTRLKVIGGGEGSGKSWVGMLFGLCRAIDKAYEHQFTTNQLIWVVGADYEDARKEIDYLYGPDYAWLSDLGILDLAGSSYPTHKDQKVILKTSIGVTFETVSSYDPKKIGREQPDGIVGCEVSRWEKEVWDRCYGRLGRKRGWGIFSGSFETSLGWFPEVFEQGQGPNELDIRSFSMPTWANKALYPLGEEDPSIIQFRAQTTEMRFMERFGGLPQPPTDSVFTEFRVMLHVNEQVEYMSDRPVFMAIDPGDKVYAVLFIQFVEDEVWIVDELYVSKWTHEQLVQGAQLRSAWASIAKSDAGTMDVASTQHHMGLGSAEEAWYRDTGMVLTTQYWKVNEQLDRLRSVLAINPATARPRLQIAPNCTGIIAEMGGGPGPVQGVGRWRMQAGVPEKRNDHACKALSYFLLSKFGTARIDSHSREGYTDVASYLMDPTPIHDNLFWQDREGVDPWQPKMSDDDLLAEVTRRGL